MTDNQKITLPAPIARLYALHLIKQELKRRQTHVQGLRKKANETSGEAKHLIHIEMRHIGSAPEWCTPKGFKCSTRAWHLVYAFLRDVPYRKVEPSCDLNKRLSLGVFFDVVLVLREVLQTMSDEDYQDLILDDRNVKVWQSRNTIGGPQFADSLKAWFEAEEEKEEEEASEPLAA